MRPIFAFVGVAILVGVTLLAYFGPAGWSVGWTGVNSSAPAQLDPPSGSTFLPSLPVTLQYTGLPAGSVIEVFSCDPGTGAVPCANGAHGWTLIGTAANGVLHFNLGPGRSFDVVTTAAAGASVKYTASASVVMADTWDLVFAVVAGIVLAAVGMSNPKHLAVSPNAPRRSPFCENCGAQYQDPLSPACENCGAARGTVG